MLREMLSDRKGRTAYVVTKLGVLAAAAVATWPLSRIFGARAWYALAAFAAIIVGVTVTVLLGSLTGTDAPPEDSDEEADDDGEEPIQETVELPIQDSIDLHSFPPRQVLEVVGDYLQAAHEAGFCEVRLIHGRGIGVQRERVQSLLGRHPLVASFRDAPPERGGWGATVAYLVDREGES